MLCRAVVSSLLTEQVSSPAEQLSSARTLILFSSLPGIFFLLCRAFSFFVENFSSLSDMFLLCRACLFCRAFFFFAERFSALPTSFSSLFWSATLLSHDNYVVQQLDQWPVTTSDWVPSGLTMGFEFLSSRWHSFLSPQSRSRVVFPF